MSAPVPPPPADDERIPPLTAQQLGLCGPLSDDPGVGPDAARHTPPADDPGRKISAAEARRIADEVLRENEQRRLPPAEDQATSGESRDDSIWALTEELEECRAHLESARACWHGWLGVASSASARLAAVRALADYLETEARAGRVAPQLHAVGALIRARLDGPAEAPAPEPVDDQVTAWIKAARDRQNPDGTPWDLGRWNVLDDLLDDYRLHRVTGTPLGQHACEGGYCCADDAGSGLATTQPSADSRWGLPWGSGGHGNAAPDADAVGPAEAAEPARPDADGRYDLDDVLRESGIDPTEIPREPGPSPVLIARCAATNEEIEAACPGLLRFRWGQPEAPCDLCGARCGIAVARWERVEGLGAPAPGYPRIADAITAACEAADIDLTVVHDGRVLDYVPGVRWLATVLDKAGLIDWSAFQDETPAEPALIGTWADPEFRAHQDHKHAVDGCGFCPSEEDR